MDKRAKFRELVRYRAGALCLVGILTATFLHTTTFMSQFFYHNLILGAIAAFAIDAGVVAMSIFKDELLRDGDLAWMVRVVTSLVLFASGIANMSEGFMSAYGIHLTWDSLTALDPLTWIQWLAGTIIFPILAYVMCDTIGTRNLLELKKQQRETSINTKAALSAPSRRGNLHAANAKIRQNKARRMKILSEYLNEHPDASLNEMADVVGVSSRETVRKYLDEMGHRSEFSRNGHKVHQN